MRAAGIGCLVTVGVHRVADQADHVLSRDDLPVAPPAPVKQHLTDARHLLGAQGQPDRAQGESQGAALPGRILDDQRCEQAGL